MEPTHQPDNRRRRAPVPTQLAVMLPLLPVWIAGVTAMGLIALGNKHLVDQLLLDSNFINGAKWYAGIVTSLGTISWTAALVSALWGAWLCRLGHRRSAGRFLCTGAALTAYVMADDLWQLHADLLPRSTGIDKHTIEMLIALVTLAWIARYLREIRRTRWMLLVASGGALALSIVFDALPWYSNPRLELLLEDGAKLLGNLGWATYFVATARDIGRSVFQEARASIPASAVGHDLDPVAAGVAHESSR